MDRKLPSAARTNLPLSPATLDDSEERIDLFPDAASKTVVFACSGCSDTGAIADQIARSLSEKKIAQMSCLAGIGGRVKSIINNAKNAHRVMVIDGCSIHCAKRTMHEAGLCNFRHLDLQELGFRKGASPLTPERVSAGVKAAKMLMMKL